jgi:peptidoglycan hydrolase CwlO-like protein
MGRTVEKFRIGATYKKPEDLPQAINKVLSNFDTYKSNIDSLKNRWRQKHNVLNFFKYYEVHMTDKMEY